MMARLINKQNDQVIAANVMKAESFRQRLVGLLGHSHLDSDSTLWIARCNSIHTWFMRFAIDVVFVDKQLKIQSIHKNVRPWRMTLPKRSADSVFEFAAGTLEPFDLKQGDQLDVAD